MRAAATGEAALDGLGEGPVDVVVLDVMLPGVDGFEVCRRLRRDSNVPVIMLTARGDDFDIVAGLEAGADDYVVKPAEPRVLDARIRAVLRRLARAGSPAETWGDLVIDRESLIVRLRRPAGAADPHRAEAAAGLVRVTAAGILPGSAARPGVGTRLPR